MSPDLGSFNSCASFPFVLMGILVLSSLSQSKECSPETCLLPNCTCVSTEGPATLRWVELPQMVTIAFDDSVTLAKMTFFRQLFASDRLNPNGCPIQATFFVCDDGGTDYASVRELYDSAHEIASHSISHRYPPWWWSHQASREDLEEEIEGQRLKLVSQAGIPKQDIRGVRFPFLEPGADRQFDMLYDWGYTYDSTFVTDDIYTPAWPFTLDFAVTGASCARLTCPTNTYPSFWEVPLNRWIRGDGSFCDMLDGCQPDNLNDKNATLSYLWDNFDRYRRNKAQFGVYLHASWFDCPWKLEALDEFIRELVMLEDVYIITMYQLIQWMRDPTPLRSLQDFEPWKSSCR